jgi:methionine-gamma-lyase
VNLTPEELEVNGIGQGSIRVSVGLEHPDDIISDFEHALSN